MSERSFPLSMTHGAPRVYGSIEEVLAHAAGHAHNRLLHACEAISWIGGLALLWPKQRQPVFTIEGARIQDATAGSGEQAAHVLPGQILIDGKPPWMLVGSDALGWAWRARFMVTSPVPVPFNTADSAAEKAGLKDAFRAGCEDAWSRGRGGRESLLPTYERFLADAGRAFRLARAGKQEKRASAGVKGDVRASDERFVESLILSMYQAHGVTAREAHRLFPLKEFAL